MKPLSGTVDVQATPAAVFALWADAPGWPRWDPDLSEAELHGRFEVGATARLKPVGGPTTRIRLTEVTPARSFSAECRLPLCRMVFDHLIEPLPDGCRVTHTIRFRGPLAMLFQRLIGPQLVRGLPGTMAGLKRAVEAIEKVGQDGPSAQAGQGGRRHGGAGAPGHDA